MDRQLHTLPISLSMRSKLYNSGFSTAEDLEKIGHEELSAECGLTHDEAHDVLRTVFPWRNQLDLGQDIILGISAFDILSKEDNKPRLVTLCEGLDKLLNGGITLGKLSEICGSPGIGKTQLCLQLCANVQIPCSCGGIEGEAVYIDTEGSFSVERLIQIAKATVHNCVNNDVYSSSSSRTSFTWKKILQGVHCFHCTDLVQLLSCINVLDNFLQQHKKVSLIVIDSLSFHFRYGFEDDYGVRNKLLCELSQTLIKLATELNIAVVITNHMTRRQEENIEPTLVPALGESWGHTPNIRLILMWEDEKRQAWVYKSPSEAEDKVEYTITVQGVRSHAEENAKEVFKNEQPFKKMKLI